MTAALDFKWIACEDVDWIQLAQIQWRPFVNKVMNVGFGVLTAVVMTISVFGVWRRVVRWPADVSDDHVASIFSI
jgi:hypothetical protein